MEYYLFGVLLLISIGSLNYAETTPSEVSKNQCDRYCLQFLKPMVDHMGVMQKLWTVCDVSKLTNTQSRLEEIEGQLVTQQENSASYSTAIEETKQKLLEQSKLIDKQKHHLRKPFQKIGSKYYYIEQQQKINWFGAAHRCTEFDSHLISLDNQSELDAIIPHLDAKKYYWIDVNDLSEKGVYRSLTTGLWSTFLNWKRNEPNNASGKENCVHLQDANFVMNDQKCDDLFFFICESFNE
ncbi:accessory gland protein Acp29AB-like isoform X2 [Drosophila montana]|uniref:accessory gland protein Acp29AB-like isoform X2 n=1 Tax=Drosophila montana TaxID=40370 RepID=UPI00313BEF6B